VSILSLGFAAFVVVTATTFWLVPTGWRVRHLALSSVVFVAFLGPAAVLLLLASVGVAWTAGVAVRDDWPHGRLLAGASVAVSVAVFFAGKLVAAATVEQNFLNSTVLPAGFAFYTFQTIAYVVEVLRGRIEPEGDPVRLLAYAAFFPHLTAGPVLAPKRVLPQFGTRLEQARGPQVADGLEQVLLGLFKKVVLADFAFQHVLSADLDDPTQHLAVYLIVPLAAYFDISGVLDIARGVGRFYGLELPRSFAQPLTRARNVSDYWRRWQIPLLTWFREYVYRPVSSRLPGRLALPGGIAATFLAAGLWHAVAWQWLAWGGLTAAAVLADHLLQNALARRDLRRPARLAWRWFRRASVYVYVVGSSWAIGQLVRFDELGATPAARSGTPTADVLVVLVLLVVALLALDTYEHRRMVGTTTVRPTPARGVAWGVAVVGIVAFWDAGGLAPFIYEGF
jgi:D-alanyl-lipoteichoic acid acyltransferase DltB (MBOAT superfamily)